MTTIDDSNNTPASTPPGYWFGEIESRLRERLRDALAEQDLRRGGWRLLHSLADSPATAAELADRLPRGRRGHGRGYGHGHGHGRRPQPGFGPAADHGHGDNHHDHDGHNHDHDQYSHREFRGRFPHPYPRPQGAWTYSRETWRAERPFGPGDGHDLRDGRTPQAHDRHDADAHRDHHAHGQDGEHRHDDNGQHGDGRRDHGDHGHHGHRGREAAFERGFERGFQRGFAATPPFGGPFAGPHGGPFGGPFAGPFGRGGYRGERARDFGSGHWHDQDGHDQHGHDQHSRHGHGRPGVGRRGHHGPCGGDRRVGRAERILADFTERGWVWFDGDRATLTDEGRAAHDEAFARVREVRASLADGIPEADFATTMATLEAMARNLGWEPRTADDGDTANDGADQDGADQDGADQAASDQNGSPESEPSTEPTGNDEK